MGVGVGVGGSPGMVTVSKLSKMFSGNRRKHRPSLSRPARPCNNGVRGGGKVKREVEGVLA